MKFYLESLTTKSFVDGMPLSDDKKIKLNTFLSKQGKYANPIMTLLNQLEVVDINYVVDNIGIGQKSTWANGHRESFDKVFYFRPSSTSQMGFGELLSAILFDGNISVDNKYDIEVNNKPCEIKTTKDGLYRFGSAKDKTIHAVIFDGIRFWNEILYTVNKIIKIGKDNILNLFEDDEAGGLEELSNDIDKIIGDVVGINSGAFPNSMKAVFNNFYQTCHLLRKGKDENSDEAEYSRVELRGNYTEKKTVNIEPISKNAIQNAIDNKKIIKIKPVQSDESRDLTIGRLNDLNYVRHPDNFLLHWKLIPSNILDANTQYIFFDKNNKIKIMASGDKLGKYLELESISDGRLKFRLKSNERF